MTQTENKDCLPSKLKLGVLKHAGCTNKARRSVTVNTLVLVCRTFPSSVASWQVFADRMFFFMQTNGNQNDLPASKADGNMQQYEHEALLDRNGKPSRKSVYET